LSSPCRRRRWPEGQALQGPSGPGYNRHRRTDGLRFKTTRSRQALPGRYITPFEIQKSQKISFAHSPPFSISCVSRVREHMSCPLPPSTIRNSGLRSPRLTMSSRAARQASLVSPHMFLTANSHLLAVLPYAEHGQQHDRRGLSVEPDASTVPSRIKRMIGSSESERAFQAPQSPFTFRHTRLTVSLLTAPPKTADGARRTRRVLVPAR
jgi:hypothetical protein